MEDMGLTKGEIKIYLTLLELGSTKVGNVIEKSNMASSAVHNSINSLIEKGLVSFVKKGKIKFYRAASSKQLVNLLDDRKRRILEILPELEAKEEKSKDKQEAEVFEGIKGVTTMLNTVIENAKKGEDYLFFASGEIPERNEEIQEFFYKYDSKRESKGLIAKGLAPLEMKPLFEKRTYLKMKYPKFPIPSSIVIHKNRVVFFSWEKKPVGYLIHSQQIAKNFRDLFKRMWNLA